MDGNKIYIGKEHASYKNDYNYLKNDRAKKRRTDKAMCKNPLIKNKLNLK